MNVVVSSRELVPIPMCLYYNPLAPRRCWMGRYGNLKCHSERKGCPDYQPSHARRQKEWEEVE